MLKKTDHIWAVSSYTKQRIIDQQVIPIEKIKIIPNTIDPYFPKIENFLKDENLLEKYSIHKEDKVLLTLCRISAEEGYKGYDRVTKALPLLQHQNVKYIIAGKYDKIEKTRIIDIAKNLGIEQQIIFTSFIKDSELIKHYLLADLFVMPSLNEGFGIVYLEAMACGIPVIAGNKDGSVDALLNGKLGTLINPENISEIAKAIDRKLKDNKFERNIEKKKKSIETVYSIFGFLKFKNNLQNLLEDIHFQSAD